MPGSPTTPGRPGARAGAPVRIAFRDLKRVGTRDRTSFAAQWLAYALPYRRFAVTLAGAAARLGAEVARYAFLAVDSHHLLLAGLPAHSDQVQLIHLNVLTYTARPQADFTPRGPSVDYGNLILAGATYWQLPEDYLHAIEATCRTHGERHELRPGT